jgi:hypothetical protein
MFPEWPGTSSTTRETVAAMGSELQGYGPCRLSEFETLES